MSKVDPFVYPIPKELTKDKETRDFFEYLVRWAHDIWVRTGGGSDTIEDTEDSINHSINGQVASLRIAVEEMQIIVASKSETASLRQAIDDLMLLSNNKAELTALRQRISDLELQQ